MTPRWGWMTGTQARGTSQQPSLSGKHQDVRQQTGTAGNRHWLFLPGPVSFEEGRVIHNGGQQGREAPQQQRGEELSDDGVLQ